MSQTDTSLAPLPPADWPDTLARVRDDMKGAPIRVHQLMAHNPQLLNAWWDFRNHSVDGGTLGRRLGELVILRVGVHLKAWYEWGSHVDRALRCGLSLDEINRVLERATDGRWPDDEAALLRAVDELVESHRLSPPTQTALARHFSAAQVMDIIAIHGMYVILGCMINTWGLTLDPQVAERIAPHTSEADFVAAAERFHAQTGRQRNAGEVPA